VQAFTHEAMDRARFGTRVETAFAVARRRIAVRAVLTGLVILLAFGAIALVLWVGGRDVLAGRISAGDLSAFVFYAVIVAMAVGTHSEVWGDVQRAAGAAGSGSRPTRRSEPRVASESGRLSALRSTSHSSGAPGCSLTRRDTGAC
jgi:ABC-type multidrug transport system fused ATPase/permease subunit